MNNGTLPHALLMAAAHVDMVASLGDVLVRLKHNQSLIFADHNQSATCNTQDLRRHTHAVTHSTVHPVRLVTPSVYSTGGASGLTSKEAVAWMLLF